MTRFAFTLAIGATAAFLLATPARSWAAQTKTATPEQVEAAIKKAVAFIYKQQQNANWEIVPRPDPTKNHSDVQGWQFGGVSAVALCALLYAGESPQQPQIKQGIEWLKRTEMYGIYAMGFRCQVWSMVPESPGIRQIAARDRDYLMAAAYPGGENVGMYPYYLYAGKRGGGGTDWYDHSVSQYGVLGMWAISQLNVEIPTAYWAMVEAGWKSHQRPTGGWGYRLTDKKPDSTRETVAMTAAGLASLFITQEMLHANDGLKCNGNYRDEHIERALHWISANFHKFRDNRPHYALYGVERIGVASGYKYFGNLNWYQVGADYLVSTQHSDGSWGGQNDHDNPKKIPDTAFGLMFLARGRAPVMMNKLDYTPQQVGPKGNSVSWNQRSREVANVARWTGNQIERDLNWQIVNLAAPVRELHDAPILWISGSAALSFKPEEMAKLKQFVEEGGIILGNADCGNRLFADSFRELGHKLFPAYKFEELPVDHPIYTSQQFKRKAWRQAPFLQHLSNGARVLMLLFPNADPARGWQTRSFAGGEREPLAQIMANIFLYAVDKKNLRYKGQTILVEKDPKIKPAQTLKLARLEYDGNWDPEPGGWRRLETLMHNAHKTDLSVTPVKLGEGTLPAGGFGVAHLTGTGKIKLTEAQRGEIKKFVEAGGTLVVDAAGGKAEFDETIRAELAGIFPEAKDLPMLKPDHAVYSTGQKLTDFEYRTFAKKTLVTRKTPRLCGLEKGGKVKVFLSSEDLSVGLVGQSVDGIVGYEPQTASSIMSNVLLYAAKK